MAKSTTLCSITHKTECMYCPVKGRALINVPKVFLNLNLLRWVTKYKYLGTILTDDLSDDFNMLSQRGICYARCNSLIRTFSSCSLNVKVKLFKKNPVVLLIAARYGANIRRTLFESYMSDITMLLEEL